MKLSRQSSRLAISTLVFIWISLLGISAALAGTVNYKQKTINESNGGWHLAMTIIYGSGPPAMQHVPFKFSFTPTAFYERYLDDKHGETPQFRKIPLVGQLPIIESVDVDFGDARGKVYNRTMFDFTITRSHNFNAGEYSVVVRRADGAQMGGAQTLILQGENDVIDRRAISFVDQKKKKVDSSAPAAANSAGAAPAQAAAEQTEASDAPAAAAAPAGKGSEEGSGAPPDSADAEKVPPSSRGCGCRVGSSGQNHAALSFLGIACGLLLMRSTRRRSRVQ
jgi:hypothetical protein